MKKIRATMAGAGAFLSVLAMSLLIAPEDSRAFGLNDEPPMEEIIVIGQRPPERDAQLNRMISEMFEQAYMDELQRQLNQAHAQLHAIEDQIRQAEDQVEERCRTIRGIVSDGTESCQQIAQRVHYVCLALAGTLALETGPGGVAAAVACEASKDHQMDQCEAHGGGITDGLMDQIEQYCPSD